MQGRFYLKSHQIITEKRTKNNKNRHIVRQYITDGITEYVNN